MKIKNRHTTSIGFGTLSVLPDAVAVLPREFTADHPVIKFYLGKKWIEIIGDSKAKKAAAQSVNVGVSITGTDEQKQATEAKVVEQATEAKVVEQTTETKAVDKMKLEELRAAAAELGIEHGEGDTRQTLIDKIKAAKEEKTE